TKRTPSARLSVYKAVDVELPLTSELYYFLGSKKVNSEVQIYLLFRAVLKDKLYNIFFQRVIHSITFIRFKKDIIWLNRKLIQALAFETDIVEILWFKPRFLVTSVVKIGGSMAYAHHLRC
ncbi:hypothetical protein L9F63_013951, partial [Diploptera punctata]